MKTALTIVFALFLSAQMLIAQSTEKDPLGGTRDLSESSEFVLLWSDGMVGDVNSKQKIYQFLDFRSDLCPTTGAPAGSLVVHDALSLGGSAGVFGRQNVSVATGDFNGDGYDNIVGVWEGTDRTMRLHIPQVNENTLEMSKQPRLKFGKLDEGGDRRIHPFEPG